ncbi:hypothetical protein [Estrella lausannensis]|uniref:Uncharacterized protein n=1 Tax=Estrella lausannensis TaxID=483423 RepID=A0A0H5E5N9_9BACT|nr:hypothetical protein [Estrella lausannensis]CRX38550.1 hypothetical protein ELAC_1209 [Estrella lausannensis]
MESREDALRRLDRLTDDLVQVAEALAQMTRHDISFTELEALQDRQNAILEEINRILGAPSARGLNTGEDALSLGIKEKLLRFEEANRVFIKNVKRLKGIIHLDHGYPS